MEIAAMGHTKWCIPDMYMKEAGNRATPSHESVTLLNTGMADAIVDIELIFDNCTETKRIRQLRVKAKSALHLRMDQLTEWQITVPRSKCYSAVISSSKKIVVEYARFNWIDGEVQSFAVMAYHD